MWLKIIEYGALVVWGFLVGHLTASVVILRKRVNMLHERTHDLMGIQLKMMESLVGLAGGEMHMLKIHTGNNPPEGWVQIECETCGLPVYTDPESAPERVLESHKYPQAICPRCP